MDVNNTTDPVWGFSLGPAALVNVHPETACAQQTACPVHKPSAHHMRTWPTTWRSDTGVLERTCPHGVGHPDPDQFEYWDAIGASYRRSHGCCGCCVHNRKEPGSDLSIPLRP